MKLSTTYIENRDQWILANCTDQKVLHIGCTDWPLTESRLKEGRLLHGKLASVAGGLVGVDIDRLGLDALSNLMPDHQFVCCPAEKLRDEDSVNKHDWDVILAADVIEHISDLGSALASFAALMSPDSKHLLTTPSAFSAKRFFAAALFGVEHVHPDHCYYFSLSTLKQNLLRVGMQVDSASMFMWKNPSMINRTCDFAMHPVNLVTGGRLADEIAISATLAPNVTP